MKKSILYLIILFSMTSCLSYSKHDLSYHKKDIAEIQTTNYSVNYEIITYSKNREYPLSENMSLINNTLIESQVEKILIESNLFKKILKRQAADYKILIGYNVFDGDYNTYGCIMTPVMAILCGLSFGLIPLYTEINYEFHIFIFTNGKQIKQYQYNRTAEVWGGIPFLFYPKSKKNKNVTVIIDDILKNFILDIRKDKLIIR